LNELLDFIEADSLITDLRHVAYMLATSKHETAHTFRPIHEHGSRSYFISRYGSQTSTGKRLGNDTPEEGATYAGRGQVQLTGEYNYEVAEQDMRKFYPDVVARFEARTGKKFDLTVGDQPNDERDPDNAMDAEIAYCIMSNGMRMGRFTGKKLTDYIAGATCDYVHARAIINGLDRASLIAGYAMKFEKILRASTVPDAVAASGLESSSTVAPAELAADTAAPQQAVESGASAAQINLAPPVEPKPIVSKPGDAPIEATTGSFKSMVTSAIGWLTGAGAGVVALLKDNQTLLIIAAAVLVIAGLAYFIRQLILDRERLRIASDPHKYNAK
jgi:hypothetical protein